MDWSDIVDVSVSITVGYNIGAGLQQVTSTKLATDLDSDWKTTKSNQTYIEGTKDISEDLACDCVSEILSTVGNLTSDQFKTFNGTVVLTYIKGTQKTKERPILIQNDAELLLEIERGKYSLDAIKMPIQMVIRKSVSSVCAACILDAGG
jgi:hypothetical protein